MPIKYLNATGRNGTDYSFGGGGNTVEVDPNAPLIHSLSDQSFYGYTVNLGGGNDVANLGYGNDLIIGGAGSDTLAGGSGNDTIYGGGLTDATSNKANINNLYGDFQGDVSTASVTLVIDQSTLALTTSTSPTTTLSVIVSQYLGNDVLFGAGGSANYTNNLYGDAASLSGTAKGGNDTLTGGSLATNTLYGDAGTMTGNAVAGDDTLVAGSGAANYLYGDAGTVFDNAVMGNDTLTGASGGSNIMAGDASGILRTSGSTTSGNDVLVGGTGIGTGNLMYGDATTLTADTGASLTGGNDILSGGNQATNTLFGDAQNLSAYRNSQITGGNDSLTGGGQATNTLFGDAQYLTTDITSQIIGGNDILFAGDGGTNTLYGDGQSQKGSVIGGDDVLVSGQGNDTMWGDVATATDGGPIIGGADVFRFLANSGTDTIMDFRTADGDKIDIAAWGVTDFTALTITGQGTSPTISYLGNTINIAGGQDGITLSASDFIFNV